MINIKFFVFFYPSTNHVCQLTYFSTVTHYFWRAQKNLPRKKKKNLFQLIIISLTSVPFFNVMTERRKKTPSFLFMFLFRRHRFFCCKCKARLRYSLIMNDVQCWPYAGNRQQLLYVLFPCSLWPSDFFSFFTLILMKRSSTKKKSIYSIK